MTAPCERCGKKRVLLDFKPNQMRVLKICASCLKKETEQRANQGQGRKPRSPSQIEDQPWKCYMNSPDSKLLELWLATEGYSGSRGDMLKRHLLAIIKTARER